MNNIYSFILGHSPELSRAEIKSVLEFKNISFQVLAFDPKFLIITTPAELDTKDLNNTLGGIIKIGKIDFFIDQLSNLENIKKSLKDLIQQNCNLENKVQFGFSLYTKNKDLKRFIEKVAFQIKKDFQQEGIKSRIVSYQQNDLSAVIISKEHLITRGIEWSILKVQERIYFSRTLAVQDFARFKALDYDRPQADSKSGMMPPKLSKIILNLSQTRGIILDPFCGSGTILLMAGELGFKKIIGADISAKAVKDSQDNLKWYQERFNANLDFYVFLADVQDLVKEGIDKNSLDCIVSEGYLGRPLKGKESLNFIQSQIKDLEHLYFNSFLVFQEVLKPQASLVISLPVFNFQNRLIYLDVLEKIETIGFQKVDLLEKKYLNERNNLIYQRKEQKVGREIIKFIKNN